MPRSKQVILAAIFALLGGSILFAQKPQAPAEKAEDQTAEKPTDKSKDEKAKNEKKPEEKIVQTKHSLRIGGEEIKYTATAGTILLKLEDGTPKASVFYIAYTRDDVTDLAKRPVTFTFNGGPGSASIWLHLGAFGPRRVEMGDAGALLGPPYKLVDNEFSMLDVTDLVFIDPVSTGYSRAVPGEAPKQFHGIEEDIQSVGDFIRLYATRNKRWTSPKFLAGESYGTTRAAGLSGYLQERYGLYLNGIILISSILNFETAEFDRGNDWPYVLFLPTYTAIAWYHKKLPADLMADPNGARQESMQFALGEYTQALASGDALTPEQRQNIIDKLNRYTGISKEVIEWANLRLDVGAFTHYLLADQRLRVGRLDGRFKGPDPDGFLNTRFFDPSSAETGPPFTSVFYDYVRRELNYKVDMPYYVSGQQSGFFQWSFSAPPGTRGGGNPFEMETSTPLREAIVKDRYLKILNMEGYYDLATPYLAAWYTFDHLDLPPEFRKNISHAQYESGHMVYLDSKAHAKMKQDFANFIDATTKR